MPRAAKASEKQRHDPLHVQLKQDEQLEKYGKPVLPGKRKKARTQKTDEEEDEENGEVRVPLACWDSVAE